eukprot:Opistho-2@90266
MSLPDDATSPTVPSSRMRYTRDASSHVFSKSASSPPAAVSTTPLEVPPSVSQKREAGPLPASSSLPSSSVVTWIRPEYCLSRIRIATSNPFARLMRVESAPFQTMIASERSSTKTSPWFREPTASSTSTTRTFFFPLILKSEMSFAPPALRLRAPGLVGRSCAAPSLAASVPICARSPAAPPAPAGGLNVFFGSMIVGVSTAILWGRDLSVDGLNAPPAIPGIGNRSPMRGDAVAGSAEGLSAASASCAAAEGDAGALSDVVSYWSLTPCIACSARTGFIVARLLRCGFSAARERVRCVSFFPSVSSTMSEIDDALSFAVEDETNMLLGRSFGDDATTAAGFDGGDATVSFTAGSTAAFAGDGDDAFALGPSSSPRRASTSAPPFAFISSSARFHISSSSSSPSPSTSETPPAPSNSSSRSSSPPLALSSSSAFRHISSSSSATTTTGVDGAFVSCSFLDAAARRSSSRCASASFSLFSAASCSSFFLRLSSSRFSFSLRSDSSCSSFFLRCSSSRLRRRSSAASFSFTSSSSSSRLRRSASSRRFFFSSSRLRSSSASCSSRRLRSSSRILRRASRASSSFFASSSASRRRRSTAVSFFWLCAARTSSSLALASAASSSSLAFASEAFCSSSLAFASAAFSSSSLAFASAAFSSSSLAFSSAAFSSTSRCAFAGAAASVSFGAGACAHLAWCGGRAEEAERMRLAAEEERKKKEEEEERTRLEAEAAAEKKKKEEEERERVAAEEKKAEEERARLAAAEEQKKKDEEERLRVEAEAELKRKEEEEKEKERARIAEEERIKKEEVEKKKKEEEEHARVAAEEENKKKAEKERLRLEAEEAAEKARAEEAER